MEETERENIIIKIDLRFYFRRMSKENSIFIFVFREWVFRVHTQSWLIKKYLFILNMGGY